MAEPPLIPTPTTTTCKLMDTPETPVAPRAGKANPGIYSVSVPDAMFGYPSSGYDDDLAWGAAWLHRATGNQTYLQDAFAFYSAAQANTTTAAPQPLAWNWDNQLPGVAYLLAEASQWQNQTVVPQVGLLATQGA